MRSHQNVSYSGEMNWDYTYCIYALIKRTGRITELDALGNSK